MKNDNIYIYIYKYRKRHTAGPSFDAYSYLTICIKNI